MTPEASEGGEDAGGGVAAAREGAEEAPLEVGRDEVVPARGPEFGERGREGRAILEPRDGAAGGREDQVVEAHGCRGDLEADEEPVGVARPAPEPHDVAHDEERDARREAGDAEAERAPTRVAPLGRHGAQQIADAQQGTEGGRQAPRGRREGGGADPEIAGREAHRELDRPRARGQRRQHAHGRGEGHARAAPHEPGPPRAHGDEGPGGAERRDQHAETKREGDHSRRRSGGFRFSEPSLIFPSVRPEFSSTYPP